MDQDSLIKLLTLGGLIAMMLAVGLKVTFEEVLASTRNHRLVLLGLVANFLLVPAVALGLLQLFDADPMISAGVLILAVCPGAPVGPPFAGIARADVPSAIGQMVVLASASALLSPALLSNLLARILSASDLHIDYLAIVKTLLVAQILPLGIGLLVHHQAPNLTKRVVKPVALLANLFLLGAVILILVDKHETLGLIRLWAWFGLLLLLVASLVIGWACGGPRSSTRNALALTTSARNAAVALVIVSSNFADTPAVTAVVAYGLVSMFGTLACALLFAYRSKTIV